MTDKEHMDFLLKRSVYDSLGIFGTFVSDDNKTTLVTCEHAFEEPDGSYLPAIPAGIYICQRRMSPKFGYDVFILENVPGHDFIEIHCGNFNSDSDGCILLGTTYNAAAKMITASRAAFLKFMAVQSGLDSFTLTIIA